MSDFRILVTGHRRMINYQLVDDAINDVIHDANLDPYNVVIVHGGASGADRFAQMAAHRMSIREDIFPANWNLFGSNAGTERNKEMVKEGADICLAFPGEDSKGTWHCAKIADKAGILVRVYNTTGDWYDFSKGEWMNDDTISII